MLSWPKPSLITWIGMFRNLPMLAQECLAVVLEIGCSVVHSRPVRLKMILAYLAKESVLHNQFHLGPIGCYEHKQRPSLVAMPPSPIISIPFIANQTGRLVCGHEAIFLFYTPDDNWRSLRSHT